MPASFPRTSKSKFETKHGFVNPSVDCLLTLLLTLFRTKCLGKSVFVNPVNPWGGKGVGFAPAPQPPIASGESAEKCRCKLMQGWGSFGKLRQSSASFCKAQLFPGLTTGPNRTKPN